MIRNVRDPSLPDHDAFVQSEPPTGRVIVIAPTRAACETIELAVKLHIDTFLETHHGNMADYKSKRRARLARALGDRRGDRGLAADVSAEELTPIRIYVRGVEIVGEAIIRPFDPRGKL